MLNRRSTTYVKLPSDLTNGGKMPEAKLTFSVNIVIPKPFEKKSQKFFEEVDRDVGKAFNKFISKQIKKFENAEDDH